jgi:hypothetical protein
MNQSQLKTAKGAWRAARRKIPANQIAKAVNRKRQALYQWDMVPNDRNGPDATREMVRQISSLSGVKCERLRPDLF